MTLSVAFCCAFGCIDCGSAVLTSRPRNPTTTHTLTTTRTPVLVPPHSEISAVRGVRRYDASAWHRVVSHRATRATTTTRTAQQSTRIIAHKRAPDTHQDPTPPNLTSPHMTMTTARPVTLGTILTSSLRGRKPTRERKSQSRQPQVRRDTGGRLSTIQAALCALTGCG